MALRKSVIDEARKRARHLLDTREDVAKAEALAFIATWRGSWSLDVAREDVIRVFRAHCGLHLTPEAATLVLLSVHDVVRASPLGDDTVILFPLFE